MMYLSAAYEGYQWCWNNHHLHTPRYIEYGNTLLGFTHGDSMSRGRQVLVLLCPSKPVNYGEQTSIRFGSTATFTINRCTKKTDASLYRCHPSETNDRITMREQVILQSKPVSPHTYDYKRRLHWLSLCPSITRVGRGVMPAVLFT